MKKKLIISILYIFSFIILFGCKKAIIKEPVNMDGVVTISASSFEETLQDTIYFKKPQIIVLETTEESLLSKINRVSYDENLLFVFDKTLMEILFFNLTGRYIGKINNKGQGPGEYIQISDFAIDTNQKQILLLCDIPNKLMYFSYDGAFIKEESLDNYYMQLVVDSNYIYFEKMNNIDVESGQLHILEKEKNQVEEVLDQIDVKNYFFINGNSLNKGEGLLYVRRFDNAVYGMEEGRAFKKYDIDFKEYSFPDRLIEEESSDVILRESSKNKYVFSMANIVNNRYCLMFMTNLGPFLYDKENNVLNGYEYIQNAKWGTMFSSYMPLDNTNKIICFIDDPSFIQDAVEHMPESKKNDERFSEMLNIAEKLTEENNPILFIYEFKHLCSSSNK